MEGLGVIVFIVIAVLAAMSRAKQMGTGTGVPRPRPGSTLPRTGQPYPRTPGDLPTPQRGESPPVLVAGSIPDEAERAAALVPDDLWAILTGERRSPLSPRPLETPHQITLPGNPPPAPERRGSSFEVVHRPQPAAEKAEDDLVWWPRLETPSSATPPPEPIAPVPALAERAAVAPRVTPSAVAAAARAPAVPVEGPAAARPARARRRGVFGGPADVRRAFVAQLVLGPPKALE